MLADRYYGGASSDSRALSRRSSPDWTGPNYQSYPVRVTADYPLSRDELMQALLERGISTRRGIMNAHQEPAYAGRARAGSAPLGGGPGRGRPAAALRLDWPDRPGLRDRRLA